MGAFLASLISTEGEMSKKKFKFSKYLIVILVFALISTSYLFPYEENLTYYCGFIYADILSLLIIYLCFRSEDFNEPKVFSEISSLSYGIFLFHWPIFVIMESIIFTPLKYIITLILTYSFASFNKNVWEKIFKNEININEKIDKYILPITSIIGIVLVFVFTYYLNNSSLSMLSLKKDLWHQGILQDIDKMRLDKSNLDRHIENITVLKEQEEIENQKTIEETSITLTKTIIGDSVLLDPREFLLNNIENSFIDAKGYRKLEEGNAIVQGYIDRGDLGDILIFALGGNAISNKRENLEKIIDILPKGHRLIFVTPYDRRVGSHPVGKIMRELAQNYDFITIMDWESYAYDNPAFYDGTDGVHFAGRQLVYDAYLKLLQDAIKKSVESPVKK